MTSSEQKSSPDSRSKISPNLKEGLKLAWNGMETALRILEKSADACPPLKSAVGGLIACLDLKDAVSENQEEYEKLAVDLGSMADALIPYIPKLATEGISGNLTQIMKSIKEESKHIKHQRGGRGKIYRLFAANQDSGDITQRYRRIESLFRQLHNNISLQTWESVRKLLEKNLLAPVDDARYNSGYSTTIHRRGCTAGTREKILEDLKIWVSDPRGEKIYWMDGMAGTGKTTISYTFCNWLEDNAKLGGNYFCSRTSPSCRNVSNIVPSLAYQLAQYFPAFGFALCEVLQKSPEASKLDVGRQLKKLIHEPMQVVKAVVPANMVIVLDALDECDAGNGTFRLFLDTLLTLAIDLPIKLFVTSRPEPAVREKMLAPGHPHSVLHLHDIEKSLVEADIQKFLAEALESMDPPPSSNDMKELAKRAGKLFIYAATAVRYLIPPSGRHVDSSTRLQMVLGKVSIASKIQYGDLDELYVGILSAAINDAVLEDYEKNDIWLILKTVICAKEPMSIQTLASLLHLNEKRVQISLQPLQSVIHMQEDVELVAPFHASFIDFLCDEVRSGLFHCAVTTHHEVLANQCFELMKEQLKFNICGLESSFVFDEDVEDLQTRIKDSISDALSYACRYWGEHFQQGDMTAVVQEKLIDFLTHRFLFWVEILNLKQYIILGGETLSKIRHLLTGSAQKQAIDADMFITRLTAGPCLRSTPHIYISGLAFCPKSSSVYKNYWRRTQGLIDVKESVTKRWQSALIGVWTTNSRVLSTACSPDGTCVISGSSDGTIVVWDSRTGAAVAGPFGESTEFANSVAYSFDGAYIVSGHKDGTIQVWDTRTGGAVVGSFEGHTESVRSVAFSPNGKYIVSGSSDQTVRVWDAHTGIAVVAPFEGHTYSVSSVAFSPDGRYIVSGSSDATIQVFNFRTGEPISPLPLKGHKDGINSVVFSPDGTRIASGSIDMTIRVWNAHTGSVTEPFKGHSASVNSVSFSPNGTCIVSGSADQTIRIWDVHTGDVLAGPFMGHTDSINSVSFSPDGTRIISGSNDGTIRVWDTQTGSTVAELFEGHTSSIRSVAFSPDGARIASGSYDRTIHVWDAQTGIAMVKPFKGHSNSIRSIAFSPNGTYIVSGSQDQTIIVWNAYTGDIVTGPLEGHTHVISSVAFSPDGAYIVSGSFDKTIRIWNTRTGDTVAGPFKGHASVRAVSFSPDGTRIGSGGSDGSIRVQYTYTGETTPALFKGHEDLVSSIAFSPDGTRIVSSSFDQTIRVWDAFTGNAVTGPCKGHRDFVHSVAFSPDGTYIVSGSDDWTIRIWDAYTGGAVTGPFKGHTEYVYSVAFSPDGTHVVSSSEDKTIRVWDIFTDDTMTGPFRGHVADPINLGVFSPDDTSIVSGSSDMTIGALHTHAGRPSQTSPDIPISHCLFFHEAIPRNLSLENFVLQQDGWVFADDVPFFWISPQFCSQILRPGNTLVISPTGTSLIIDSPYLFIGKTWSQCYCSFRE